MSKLGLVAALLAIASVSVFGQGKPKTAAVTACPICHMPLSAKKTAANPVAVKLTKGGKTMYCCPKCKMPASVLVKAPTKKSTKA